jgi:hypothetical protein
MLDKKISKLSNFMKGLGLAMILTSSLDMYADCQNNITAHREYASRYKTESQIELIDLTKYKDHNFLRGLDDFLNISLIVVGYGLMKSELVEKER